MKLLAWILPLDLKACVEIDAAKGAWRDASCGEYRPFICKRKMGKMSKLIGTLFPWYLQGSNQWHIIARACGARKNTTQLFSNSLITHKFTKFWNNYFANHASLCINESSVRRPRSHYKLLSFFEISSPLLKYLFTHFATQLPHQCTVISLFIPFVDTYNYVYVCNVHTSTVISFIRSSKFVYIVYVIT